MNSLCVGGSSWGSIRQQSITSERLTSAVMAKPASIRYSNAISRSVNEEQELTWLSISVCGLLCALQNGVSAVFVLKNRCWTKNAVAEITCSRRQVSSHTSIGRSVGPPGAGDNVTARPYCVLVGERGFEPPTSSSRTKRATELRYSPKVYKSITHVEIKEQIGLTAVGRSRSYFCAPGPLLSNQTNPLGHFLYESRLAPNATKASERRT